MSSETLEAIDRSIKQAQALVELGSAVDRLRSNKDFKKIVIEGYFEKEAIRLVHLKADPSMQSAASQQSINQQMDAIGAFSQYLDMTLRHADQARKQIASDESMRDEILTGDE